MISSNEEGGDQQTDEKQAPEESNNGVSPLSEHPSGSDALAFAHATLERPLRRIRRNRFKKAMDAFADNYPRLFAIFCGILIPLFTLIALATLFGYWIAQIESPVEISYNDYQLAIWTQQNFRLEILSTLSAVTPRICLRLFIENSTESGDSYWDSLLNLPSSTDTGISDNETLFLVTLGALASADHVPESFVRENSNLNVSELYSFLSQCGSSIHDGITNYTALTVVVPNSDEASLTFNWNRCTPYRVFDPNYTASIRPANQSAFYTQNWLDNATAIYEKYYEYYTTPPQNLSSQLATALASNRSFFEATGSMDCVVNQYAGAWFWFTIMTTIGYGNAAIETTEGRTLVYTLGFFSILAFGGILIGAGSVVTAIADDASIRLHQRRLANPWVASFMWGALYYVWMIVIANFYVNWTERRLGTINEVSMRDGYWFAYISTTTIGLGDFILTPGVLRAIDMVSWPFNFLVGFVFFSAFVGKLSQIVLKPMQDNADHLARRLRERGMIYGDARVSSNQTDVVPANTSDAEQMSIQSSNSEVFISPGVIPAKESGSSLSV